MQFSRWVPTILASSTLKMEAESSFETLLLNYKITLDHIPDGCDIYWYTSLQITVVFQFEFVIIFPTPL
jgi:hypothetical protein